MGEPPLSRAEVRELLDIFEEHRDSVRKLHSKYKLANNYINYPKLPPELGESIVVHLIKDRCLLKELPNDVETQLEGHDGDIRLPEEDTLIEVKSASSKDGFTRLSERDVNADYLVYVYLGEFFRDKSETIEVLLLDDHSTYYEPEDEAYKSDLRNHADETVEINPNNL